MRLNPLVSILSLPFLLCSCSKPEPTNAELFHQAYLNVIEASEDELRPLVNLTKQESKVDWNQEGDRVLLFTFHRYPDSYPEKKTITFSWGESWVCSVKEYALWAKENKGNITDALLRTKQLLGMEESSKNTYVSSMWFSPSDLMRPAYVTDVTKPMALTFEESATEEYKRWFQSQFYYSYETKRMPWTRLGYTYDWSKEAKDRYGLSEFIAWKGTSVLVERTCTVETFFQEALAE